MSLQNAMRATMELYGDAMEYPPIHAQVALGSEDMTVKVTLLRSRNILFLFTVLFFFTKTYQGKLLSGCKKYIKC